MTCFLKLAPAAAAACIAMTLATSAAPLASDLDIPTGDVWITPQAPSVAPAQIARRAPAQRPLPTGDFWPADDDTTRAAEAPALPRDQSAARETDAREP
jgi:hypothetical protein